MSLRSGYWTEEDAERFIRNEVEYQIKRGATAEQCEVGVRDMRLRLLPHLSVPDSAHPTPTAPVDSSSASRPSSASSTASSSSAPAVTFESLCAFFSTWPLREIRKHTEELVSHAQEKRRELTLQVLKQRRVSRSEVSSGGAESSVSYSRSRFSSAGGEAEMSEAGEAKAEHDGMPPADDGHAHPLLSVSVEPRPGSAGEPYSVAVSLAPGTPSLPPSSSSSSVGSSTSSSGRVHLALSLPLASLSDLLVQMAVLHDEISSLNAQQRQMNEDGRRLSDRLLAIDSSRLTIIGQLDTIQAELTANHSRHVQTTSARNANEERLKAVLKRYEEVAEEGHRLAREVEVCRETLVSMRTQANDLAKASKQAPDHLKALDKSVADETAKLALSTKAHRDAQHMIAMLESELSAQEKAMQGTGAGGRGGGAAGQAALSRLRSKLAGYRKVEREKEEEMKASSEALKRWEDEKEGDEELQRIGGQMALYKTSVKEKKEQLGQLTREFDAQQTAQERLDTERRVIFNDINTAKKTEKLILTRIQQLSENYASGDQQVALLSKDREDLIRATRSLVDRQAAAEARVLECLMELECLCDDVQKAKEDEEEQERRDERLMEEEEESQRRELELKLANGWEPDETYVPPCPTPAPRRGSPSCGAAPCGSRWRVGEWTGLVHINRCLLTVENIVHPQQKREDGIRVCVDVAEIIDIKLKAADQTGQPTLTLQRMPTVSPPPPAVHSPPQAPTVSAGSPPPVALPVARPVSHRNSLSGGTASALLTSPASSSNSIHPPAAAAAPSTSASSSSASSPSSASLTAVVSQAYEAASSLLDTVVGPVAEAVNHAVTVTASSAASVVDSAAAATSTAVSALSSAVTPSPTPSLTAAPSPLSIPAVSGAGSPLQPFSPALSPSSVQPSLRRTLSLAARQISLTLRPGYRNRFLVAVDSDSSAPTPLSHSAAPIQRMSLTADESHLQLLFQCLRHNLQARRRKSFSALASPPSTPPSLSQSPTSAPSTPTNPRAAAPSAAVSQSAGKAAAKESFAERQLRKKKRRERKERELQHRREVAQAREEVYVEGASEIVPAAFLQRLIRHTPARYHLSVWSCVYSMTVHGVSFNALLAAMADKPCGILLIRDMQGRRFGGYASNPFVSNAQAMNAYYGTGECWVWEVRKKTEEEKTWDERDRLQQTDLTSHPSPPSAEPSNAAPAQGPPPPGGVVAGEDETIAVYRWSGLNDFFMFTGADPPFIAMGGGGAFAWRLDESLRFGTSGECSTFQSPALTAKKDFEAILFEVWAPVRGKF